MAGVKDVKDLLSINTINITRRDTKPNNPLKNAAIELFKLLDRKNYLTATTTVRAGDTGEQKTQDVGEALEKWINTQEGKSNSLLPTPEQKTARALIKMLFKVGPTVDGVAGTTSTDLIEGDFGTLKGEAVNENILRNFFLMGYKLVLNKKLLEIKADTTVETRNAEGIINDNPAKAILGDDLNKLIKYYHYILNKKLNQKEGEDGVQVEAAVIEEPEEIEEKKAARQVVIKNLPLIESLDPKIQEVFKNFIKFDFNKDHLQVQIDLINNELVEDQKINFTAEQILGWSQQQATYQNLSGIEKQLPAKEFIKKVTDNPNSVVNILSRPRPLVKKTVTTETTPEYQTALVTRRNNKLSSLIDFWQNIGNPKEEIKPVGSGRPRSSSVPIVTSTSSTSQPTRRNSVIETASEWYKSTIINFSQQFEETQAVQIRQIQQEIVSTQKNITNFVAQTNPLLEHYKNTLNNFLDINTNDPNVKDAIQLFENLAKKIIEQQENADNKDINEKIRKANRQKLQTEIDKFKKDINNIVGLNVRVKALILFQGDQEKFYKENIQTNANLTDRDHSFYVALYGKEQLPYLLEARELAIQRQLTEAVKNFKVLIEEGEINKAVKVYGDLTEALGYYIKTNLGYSTIAEWNETLNSNSSEWRNKLQATVTDYTKNLKEIQEVLLNEIQNNPLNFVNFDGNVVDLNYKNLWGPEEEKLTSNPDSAENNNQAILDQQSFMERLTKIQEETQKLWDIFNNNENNTNNKLNQINAYGFNEGEDEDVDVDVQSSLEPESEILKIWLIHDLETAQNIELLWGRQRSFKAQLRNSTTNLLEEQEIEPFSQILLLPQKIYDQAIITTLHAHYQNIQNFSKFYPQELLTEKFQGYTNLVNQYVTSINQHALFNIGVINKVQTEITNLPANASLKEINTLNIDIEKENTWIKEEIQRIYNLITYIITERTEENPNLNAEKYYNQTVIKALGNYRKQLQTLSTDLTKQQNEKIQLQLKKAEEASEAFNRFMVNEDNSKIINDLERKDGITTGVKLIPLIEFYKGTVAFLKVEGLDAAQIQEIQRLQDLAQNRINLILNNVPAYNANLDADPQKDTKIWNRNEVVEVLNLERSEYSKLFYFPSLNWGRRIQGYNTIVTNAIENIETDINELENSTESLANQFIKAHQINNQIFAILDTHKIEGENPVATLSEAHVGRLNVLYENMLVPVIAKKIENERQEITESTETPQSKLAELQALFTDVNGLDNSLKTDPIIAGEIGKINEEIANIQNQLVQTAENEINNLIADIDQLNEDADVYQNVIAAIARYKELAAYVVDPAIPQDKADALNKKIDENLAKLKTFTVDNINKPEIRQALYTAEVNNEEYIAEIFKPTEQLEDLAKEDDLLHIGIAYSNVNSQTAINLLKTWETAVLKDYNKILQDLNDIKNALVKLQNEGNKTDLKIVAEAREIAVLIDQLYQNKMSWDAIKTELETCTTQLIEQYQVIHNEAAEKIANVDPDNDEAVEEYVKIVHTLQIKDEEYVKEFLKALYKKYKDYIDDFRKNTVEQRKGLRVQLEALGELDSRFGELFKEVKTLQEPIFTKLTQADTPPINISEITTQNTGATTTEIRTLQMVLRSHDLVKRLLKLTGQPVVKDSDFDHIVIFFTEKFQKGDQNFIKAFDPIIKNIDTKVSQESINEVLEAIKKNTKIPNNLTADSALTTKLREHRVLQVFTDVEPNKWKNKDDEQSINEQSINEQSIIKDSCEKCYNKQVTVQCNQIQDATLRNIQDKTKVAKDMTKANQLIQRVLICVLYGLEPGNTQYQTAWNAMNKQIDKENNQKQLNQVTSLQKLGTRVGDYSPRPGVRYNS